MSNETKHTPGPWEARERDFDEWVIGNSDGIIGSFYQEPSENDTAEERLANAALIAQAPDLLEASRFGLEFANNLAAANGNICQPHYLDAPDSKKRDFIIAAIAKAEGK